MAADDRIRGSRQIGILNGVRTFKDSIGLKDKNDYFSFRLNGKSSFQLALSKLQNNVDVSLIRGSQVIASGKKQGKKSETINSTLEAGTYSIRVYPKQGKSKYQLKLSATPFPAEGSPTPSPSPSPLPSPSPAPSGTRHFLSALTGRVSTITPNDGATATLADGNLFFTDLAAFNNDLFGVTFNSLYRIDPNTGASTLVGNLGVFGMNALGFAPSGELYAAGGSGFYTVNLTTGAATRVANIPDFASSGDLVYDSTSGRFLATSLNGSTDALYSIGTGGDARLVGNVGFSNVWGLLFDNGTLYGYTSDQKQIVINPTTGAGTFDRTLADTSGPLGGAT